MADRLSIATIEDDAAAPVGGLFYFRLLTPSWFAGSLAVKLRRRSTYEKLWPCESSSQRRSLRYWRWPPRPKAPHREKGQALARTRKKRKIWPKRKPTSRLIRTRSNKYRYPRKSPTPGKPVSYTHLRAHETRHDLVCRLL